MGAWRVLGGEGWRRRRKAARGVAFGMISHGVGRAFLRWAEHAGAQRRKCEGLSHLAALSEIRTLTWGLAEWREVVWSAGLERTVSSLQEEARDLDETAKASSIKEAALAEECEGAMNIALTPDNIREWLQARDMDEAAKAASINEAALAEECEGAMKVVLGWRNLSVGRVFVKWLALSRATQHQGGVAASVVRRMKRALAVRAVGAWSAVCARAGRGRALRSRATFRVRRRRLVWAFRLWAFTAGEAARRRRKVGAAERRRRTGVLIGMLRRWRVEAARLLRVRLLLQRAARCHTRRLLTRAFLSWSSKNREARNLFDSPSEIGVRLRTRA
ncbi:hypothetical protein T484DRAFT_1897086, partial [Baffinella frigidus]